MESLPSSKARRQWGSEKVETEFQLVSTRGQHGTAIGGIAAACQARAINTPRGCSALLCSSAWSPVLASISQPPLVPCSHKGGRRWSTCLVPSWQRSQPLDTHGVPGADGKVISGALWHPGPVCAHTQQLTIPLATPEAMGRQISYVSWLEKLRKCH